MNNLLRNLLQTDHLFRDTLIPLSISLVLIIFLVWAIIVSLRTPSHPFQPNQTITIDTKVEGGENL